ncbi:radical SAM protein [Candidatus Bathyarchaeota archaeon]|nr:radical SAM protein [Candidatus Bathyarchaeota archaeon]
MTILVIPWLGCNLRCAYCFSRTFTHKPQKLPEIRFDKVEESLKKLLNGRRNLDVCVHGGEPLALPKLVLERLFKMVYEINGRCSIQTNLYNLDEDHIEMFKKYKVSIGASIDGPRELNVLRGFPDEPEKQKTYLKKVYENLDKLVAEKINVSIIAVLHKVNAGTREAREKMKKWFVELADKGIRYGRTNPLFDPFESPQIVKWRLSQEELAEAFVDFFRFFLEHPHMHWSPYRDVVDVMLGLSTSLCIFGECDIFSSNAAIAIYPDGTLGTCDRYYGFGLIRRNDPPLKVRYEVLPLTECKNCKYWKICRGACPAEALHMDWRRKSYFCHAYYRLFQEAEKYLKALMPNVVLAHEVPYDWRKTKHNPFEYVLKTRSSWRYCGLRLKQYVEKWKKAREGYHADGIHTHTDKPHLDWSNHGDSR